MYCPQCGTANDDAASFCTKCGVDLQNYREQWAAAPAVAGDPAAGQQPDGTAQPDSGQQPAAPPAAYPPPYQQQYQPTYQTAPAYQPAPYQPAGYQPGYGTIPNIPSYMAWAIITLILCFWPTGIVAVVYASKVGNRLVVGDVPGAQEASRKAKMWCWITFGIAVAGVVIAIIGFIIFAVAATSITVQ
jgi:hypothetical protein